MNERIKQLAQVAEQLADDELAHLERVHNRLYSFTEGREIYNQKFAELIIQEMCQVMKVEGEQFSLDQNFDAMKGVGRCMRKVKEHFGVEE